jgi:hypothetical protein
MPVSLSANGIIYADGTSESTLFSDTRALFAFGYSAVGVGTSITNTVTSSGVIGSDVTVAGFARYGAAGATYGGNKMVFGFGNNSSDIATRTLTLFNNNGAYVSESNSSGTARSLLAAAGYGGDKAIFGFGFAFTTEIFNYKVTNLISNVGAYVSEAANASISGGKDSLAAATYGGDKAIFGFGGPSNTNSIQLFNNLGVFVSERVSGTDSSLPRSGLAAATYGGDKAMFGYGFATGGYVNRISKFSNTGSYISESTNASSPRYSLAATTYGGDKVVFGFGYDSTYRNTITKFSNSGDYISESSGVGTARYLVAAASFSL